MKCFPYKFLNFAPHLPPFIDFRQLFAVDRHEDTQDVNLFHVKGVEASASAYFLHAR